MRYVVVVLALLMSACATPTGFSSGAAEAQFSARPEEDVARDAGRKPQAVLDFLGVQAGMSVMDVLAAGGYYTEVLANRVGPNGKVYAQNSARMLRFGGGRNDRAMTTRLYNNRLPNVRRLDRDFSDLGLVPGRLDAAITALNFHDIYNNSPQAAAAMLGTVFTVLIPGGVLGIIDHTGNANADNKSLHRIDPALVIAAAEAAGFEVAQSGLLANPNDDHTQNPFAPSLRGNTDRFLLKLTKPE